MVLLPPSLLVLALPPVSLLALLAELANSIKCSSQKALRPNVLALLLPMLVLLSALLKVVLLFQLRAKFLAPLFAAKPPNVSLK